MPIDPSSIVVSNNVPIIQGPTNHSVREVDIVGHSQMVVQHFSYMVKIDLCFVPIDPSCAVISTKVAITQGPTPTPSPIISPVANTTCSVLKNLAENADYFKCTSDTTPPCDTVYCTEELGNEIYNAVILLLPCQTPAAVRVTLTSDDDGKTILNETVDSSREITVPDLLGFTLGVTLDHFEDAIGLQVLVVCVCVCVCVCLTILPYVVDNIDHVRM